mgnify:CR=1 FL=1
MAGMATRNSVLVLDGDKIAAIGKNLGSGKKEIDAKGQVVAPGFIDSHTHMDAFIVQYPNGNPVVNYGVTSIVIGDCGASCAPRVWGSTTSWWRSPTRPLPAPRTPAPRRS